MSDEVLFAVFDCSDEKEGDIEYYNKLRKCFTPEAADMFFTYIYNLEDVVDISKPPTLASKKIRTKKISSVRKQYRR